MLRHPRDGPSGRQIFRRTFPEAPHPNALESEDIRAREIVKDVVGSWGGRTRQRAWSIKTRAIGSARRRRTDRRTESCCEGR